MKFKLFFIAALVAFSISAQKHPKVNWSEDYKSILKKAKRNHKNIIVYFSGSDWCKPCIKLKKDLFEQQSFSNIAENYNLLYVDIPQNQDLISASQYKKNKELMAELNPRKVFPTVMILDSRGRVKEKISGYSSIADPTNYLSMIAKYK